MAYREILRQLVMLDYLEQMETQAYYARSRAIRATEKPVLKSLDDQLTDTLCDLLGAREQFGYLLGFQRAVALLERDKTPSAWDYATLDNTTKQGGHQA